MIFNTSIGFNDYIMFILKKRHSKIRLANLLFLLVFQYDKIIKQNKNIINSIIL